MGLQPKINKPTRFKMRECVRCGCMLDSSSFAPTKSPFFADGAITICNSCIDSDIAAHDWNWDYVDKLCQMADIPFVPKEWERLRAMNNSEVFYRYAQVFQGAEYQGLHWDDYFHAFEQLQKDGRLEEELPGLGDARRKELQDKWGHNYDDEALAYLDNLYCGLLNTQNVSGSLQKDQAEKICKISYEIDLRIRENQEFDKLLASYDKLVKAADFTPKNVKNLNDFDSCGELIKWLEKKGWTNPYYDNVPKDIVDETIANIQASNQRLYTNESGIGDEITSRLQALREAEKLERGDYYTTPNEISDLDQYEVAGFDELFKDNDVFEVELEENKR